MLRLSSKINDDEGGRIPIPRCTYLLMRRHMMGVLQLVVTRAEASGTGESTALAKSHWNQSANHKSQGLLKE